MMHMFDAFCMGAFTVLRKSVTKVGNIVCTCLTHLASEPNKTSACA